jgi:predicted restriction endonuclease
MKSCEICDKAIPPDRTSNNVKYCGLKCARKAEASQQTKRIVKRAQNINKIAYMVYQAYGFKCAICGWQATENIIVVNGKLQYARGNAIHHITPIRENGKETAENLILLCPNHHKQADMGVIRRDKLRHYTRDFELTIEEKHKAIMACTDAIARLIF